MAAVPWVSRPLGEVATLQRGYDLPHRLREAGRVPVVTSSGVGGTHAAARVKGPGVVTGRYGTIGEVFFVEKDFWPLNTTLYVKDFHGNDPLFISYLLRTIDFRSHSGKSGVPGVNRNDLHGLEVLVPGVTEQVAIATVLSDIDGLLVSLDQLIAKKRSLKQGVMQELLTGSTRLPGFTDEWTSIVIGVVLRFQVGFPFSSSFFSTAGHGLRLIRNRDLKADDAIVYYSGSYDSSYLVHDGDVLVGMDGDFMPSRWQNGPALLNQRVGRLVPLDDDDATFFAYSLIDPLKDIERATSSTTVKHLSHADVEAIEMPVPSAQERRAIAAVLSDMDAEIEALEARRAKTALIKRGIAQALLTGRIRLPLDDRPGGDGPRLATQEPTEQAA